MAIATLTHIERTFGERVLFEGLNLSIDRGERVGLIGANGAGKTSIFKLFTGDLSADTGIVATAKGVKLGHLSQDPVFDPANTVLDEAELGFSELHALSHQMRELEHRMGEETDEALEKTLARYQNVQHEFDLAGGYAWTHRLEGALLGIGLGRETWEQKVATLSGGQRSRLALVKLLIGEPDLLLLDEPTNHLDLAAIDWLEKYLLEYTGAVLLISHDRYFLDRLVTRIVWLNQRKLASFKGNYSAFVEQRELQELTQQREYEKQHADIEKQAEYVRRFKAGQRARQAKGREKRLDRLLQSDALVKDVAAQSHIHLSLNTDQRAGDQVLKVRELSKSYDNKELWRELKFDVTRGERIGILGPNGAGKTTMLEVLLGAREADAGDIRWGANLKIGYYDQGVDDFDPENTVLEEIAQDRVIPEKQIRDALAMLLFRGEDVHKPIKLLSGGERARVRLTELLMDRPNVLVLDEPTNHLDIASCEALEGALRGIEGTILCVSHDRYFLDKVARRLFVLKPPGLDDFDGNYSAWMAKQKRLEQRAAEEAAEAEKRTKRKSSHAKGAAYVAKGASNQKPSANGTSRPFRKLSLKELEEKIAETEVALAERQEWFASPDQRESARRGKGMREEYEAMSMELKQLEAEYFAREEE